MNKIIFFMEQHLGHKTYYQNLRKYVDQFDDVEPTWVEVTYNSPFPYWDSGPHILKRITGLTNGLFEVQAGLMRHTDYDLVFCFTQNPAVYAGRKLGRTPYVLCSDVSSKQMDDMAQHYNHSQDKNKLLKDYKHNTNIKLYNNAACFVAWSDWMAQSLYDDYGLSKQNVEIIPIGIDQTIWNAQEKSGHSGPVRILFVGGDFYRKGGQLLLDAFNKLEPNTAELHIITRSEVEMRDSVFVYNNLQANSPELISKFQEADVFVFPTLADSFGIVALEAMAMGLPIIGTNIAALPEIIKHGETGYIVEPGDSDQLHAALAKLISDPELRVKMGENGIKRVSTLFSAERNARRVIDLCNKIIQRNKSVGAA